MDTSFFLQMLLGVRLPTLKTEKPKDGSRLGKPYPAEDGPVKLKMSTEAPSLPLVDTLMHETLYLSL